MSSQLLTQHILNKSYFYENWTVLLWSHLLFHNRTNELLLESLRIHLKDSIGTRRVNYKLVIEYLLISNKIPIVCLTNPYFFQYYILYISNALCA